MLTQKESPAYYTYPQFADAASCVEWLESIPLENTSDAHEMVAAQIGLLARAELSALERLRILEVLYQPAAHLQAELARRFAGRALPLSIVEYSIWNTVLELWQSLYASYAACLEACLTGEARLAAQAPLVTLRCIDLTSAAIREHHRVYREIPAALWTQLNETYACAERQGAANVGISDPLRPAQPARTITSAYGRILLAHQSNPYTMSPKQMTVMYRWAGLWDTLISVVASPPAPGLTSVLAVDLKSATPAVSARQVVVTPTVRYLALDQLGHALRRTLTLLRAGHQPASLGLGDDCRQPGTERLLTLLYIQWCGAGMGQLAGPRERLEDARACVGLSAVLMQLETEAQAGRPGASAIRTAFSPYTENWHTLSVNTPGFIGVCRGPECDARIQHHQLVALKRRSASAFQLGVTQWLKLEDDGDLSIGVRLWPGTAQPVKFRVLDDDEMLEIEGLMLPAVQEMSSPATLVLASGVFRPELRIELAGTERRTARLVRLTERGIDFERAILELVD